MTGQQLKNSILQMAVQGKLVPQDPNDEPASVLLERIRAEKERLIKEKKIKKEKNPSVIFRSTDNSPYTFLEKIGDEVRDISDEIPFDIPESWEWVHLSQIAISELGKTLDKAKNTGEFKPYLCSINVHWNGVDLSKVKEARFEESELYKFKLHKGDLLICEGGDVGRSCVWDRDDIMYYQNALHRVRFYDEINPHYYKYLIECYKGIGIIDEHSKGMTIKHLVQSSLNNMYFPLPPLAEQRRIVAKIEELLPYIENYTQTETKLNALNTTFPTQLKKSILQQAVQGKLVPQNPDDEPASVLLERIRAEKQELIKAGKIKKDKNESVIFRRDNSHYEMVNGVERCIDDEIPFEVPENWQWVRFSQIASFENGDRSSKYPVETDYVEDGIPFLGAKDMGEKYISFDKVRFISQQKFDELGNGKLQDGDLIYLLRGNVGKTRIFKANNTYNTGFICAQMLIIRCLDLKLLDFVYTVISSPFYTKCLDAKITGTAVRQLPAKEVANSLIPIPPLEEQRNIVKRISQLFKYCEKL